MLLTFYVLFGPLSPLTDKDVSVKLRGADCRNSCWSILGAVIVGEPNFDVVAVKTLGAIDTKIRKKTLYMQCIDVASGYYENKNCDSCASQEKDIVLFVHSVMLKSAIDIPRQ